MHGSTTRRGVLLGLGGIVTTAAHAQSKKPDAFVHQEIDFKTTPTRIYGALLDAKQFAAFSKDKAEIEPHAGGTFKLFGGRIEGRTVELVSNKRIVQAWRASAWQQGVYTVIRFELLPQASGTRIIFDQAGYLTDLPEWTSLDHGWPTMYWQPLREYFGA